MSRHEPEPGLFGRHGISFLPSLSDGPIEAPVQLRLGASAGAAAPSAGPVAPLGGEQAERISGPHLRAVVVVACGVLWVATRLWLPQLSVLPFVMLCTLSSSALWCTPTEFVVSLGPVPVCLFRRRIPYKQVGSVSLIQGRLQVLQALLGRGLRFWRPLGVAYGLTMGKAVVDITLLPEVPEMAATSEDLEGQVDKVAAAEGSRRSCLQPLVLLVSVDDAEDVVAHILFRRDHGPDVPLPEALRPQRNRQQPQWVVCDAFDLLLAWTAKNQVMCDVCSLLLQHFQPQRQEYAIAGQHSRSA